MVSGHENCPRCAELITSYECTEERPHPACLERPLLPVAHAHWRCRSCGLAWVEMPATGDTTLCPFCYSDLAGDLKQVPSPVREAPFPFRCVHCQHLLKVSRSEAGLRLGPFAPGQIARPGFRKRQDHDASQAG